MKRTVPSTCLFLASLAAGSALDEFNNQMLKAAHEELGLERNVVTESDARRCPDAEWFRNLGLSARYIATDVWFDEDRFERSLYTPAIGAYLQTVGGVQLGMTYSYQVAEYEVPPSFGFFGERHESEAHSVGGYVGKQFACGFKIATAWSYTDAKVDAHSGAGSIDYDVDRTSGSAGIGFARSFGDKTSWKNVFVDTSANLLYQSEEQSWVFAWNNKLGHNICPRFAVYGIFNLYHSIDEEFDGLSLMERTVAPYGGYHPPFWDETWGEVGGGFETRLLSRLVLRAEATTPVMIEYGDRDFFQFRGALHWEF
jgi:hypothetical protein